ncbi:RNA polymerase II-associated protein [Lentinus tigrinus ALCF2SS1-7]|uniref:RNA polymerase II-associated protein n=1 Tax=Lentinus tigrinus ALCF2SS1-6 TaxID=1328759 RepID=A0A5C2RXH2_9APHY|nr:RNA polymerase II-associated protein [Lentinus tigrinus ALCF2SS1-6]RPD69119.1 RNA polymerase II-associated protein [Lentinus tigrinus ALCF2SS1-7]
MSSEDVLLALKQTVSAKGRKPQITFKKGSTQVSSFKEATHLVLANDLTVPKDAPTRLRKPGTSSTDPQANPQDFIPLGAVYLAWQLREAPGAEYMKQVRENGYTTGFVSVTEKKGVVDWLQNKSQTLPGLVSAQAESTTPPGTPPQLRGSTSLPSVASLSRAGDSTTSPLKRRYVADTADIEVVKKIKRNEIELQDRSTVLRGIKPNNFTSLKDSFAERLKKLREGGRSSMMSSSLSSIPDPKMQPRKPKNHYPIIMISSSPTSLITMHNVRKFLQDAVFETSQDARARAASEGNARPEDMIPIYRKRTTIDSSGRETEMQTRYFVVDSTEALAKFGPDAWDRVVCVMTTGQAWQFRPYKWTEPKTLFHHVKGIYFTWTNDPPNPKIKDWNVTELKIDPHRRHVDKSVVAHFWRILDQWTSTNKPSLVQG